MKQFIALGLLLLFYSSGSAATQTTNYGRKRAQSIPYFLTL